MLSDVQDRMSLIEAKGRYECYKRGWIAGASGMAYSSFGEDVPEYEGQSGYEGPPQFRDEFDRGFEDGGDAFRSAMKTHYAFLVAHGA